MSKLVTIIFSQCTVFWPTSYNREYYYERLLLLVSLRSIFFWDKEDREKRAETKKMSVNESCRTRRRSFCCIGFKTERLMGTRGRPFQMHRERDRRKKRGWKRHTHTLRHIETRDRLKIAAKIDGKRIMLKASGQWRHAYRNQPTALDRERNEKKEKEKNNIHFCANEWTV